MAKIITYIYSANILPLKIRNDEYTKENLVPIEFRLKEDMIRSRWFALAERDASFAGENPPWNTVYGIRHHFFKGFRQPGKDKKLAEVILRRIYYAIRCMHNINIKEPVARDFASLDSIPAVITKAVKYWPINNKAREGINRAVNDIVNIITEDIGKVKDKYLKVHRSVIKVKHKA